MHSGMLTETAYINVVYFYWGIWLFWVYRLQKYLLQPKGQIQGSGSLLVDSKEGVCSKGRKVIKQIEVEGDIFSPFSHWSTVFYNENYQSCVFYSEKSSDNSEKKKASQHLFSKGYIHANGSRVCSTCFFDAEESDEHVEIGIVSSHPWRYVLVIQARSLCYICRKTDCCCYCWCFFVLQKICHASCNSKAQVEKRLMIHRLVWFLEVVILMCCKSFCRKPNHIVLTICSKENTNFHACFQLPGEQWRLSFIRSSR